MAIRFILFCSFLIKKNMYEQIEHFHVTTLRAKLQIIKCVTSGSAMYELNL